MAVDFDLLIVDILVAGEDGIDDLLARDVLYLSAREIEVVGEVGSLFVVESLEHGLPDLLAGLVGRFLELEFEEETAVEGLVEAAGKVGGTDHDAIEFLHLL